MLPAMCLLMISSVGCDQGPQVGAVTGTISYQGQPMEGIEVTFDPDATGRSSRAVTDSSGHYKLRYTRQREGALVGNHKVRLEWPVQNEKDFRNRQKYPIPSSYNTDTTLTFEVKKGSNVFDLNIEAG